MGRLNEKQRQAIPLLTTGHTQRQVAKMLGVNERTVSKWVRNNVEFAGELSSVYRDRKQAARALVDAAVPRVLGVAIQIALDTSAHASARLTATRLVLETAGVLGSRVVAVEAEPVGPRLATHSDEEIRDELERFLGARST